MVHKIKMGAQSSVVKWIFRLWLGWNGRWLFDNAGSYTYQDFFENVNCMISFANAKDDRFFQFLMPFMSMTEDNTVRSKMVKRKDTLMIGWKYIVYLNLSLIKYLFDYYISIIDHKKRYHAACRLSSYFRILHLNLIRPFHCRNWPICVPDGDQFSKVSQYDRSSQ